MTWRVAIVLVLFASIGLAQPAPDADVRLLQSAQIASDGPALVEYFKRRTVGPAEVRVMAALVAQLGDDAFPVRERATQELIAKGLPAVGLLRQAASSSDIEVARRAGRCLQAIERVPSAALSAAAARLLAQRKPDGAIAALLGYLPLADDTDVADEVRAALAALSAGASRVDPALTAAVESESPLIRGAAAETLIRAGAAKSSQFTADPDVDVRLRSLVAAVVHAKEKSAVAGLIDLLPELNQSQAFKTEELLIRVAGDSAPAASLGAAGDRAARLRCRDAWSAWWTRTSETTDLTNLNATPQTLGLTLIVVQGERGAPGRVYEIDAAGKQQWSFDGLQAPMDAIVIGPNRVLVAENAAEETVTLRDFRGTKLWGMNLPSPVGLQTLPRGDLFVATRAQLREHDSKRAVTFEMIRPVPDIVAGSKDRNGEYVFITNRAKCMRVDGKGKELSPGFDLVSIRGTLLGLEPLPRGRVLVAGTNEATEYDADGTVGWSVHVPAGTTSVQRLTNGNTLVNSVGDRRILEFDRDRKMVWDHKLTDPGIPRRARRR